MALRPDAHRTSMPLLQWQLVAKAEPNRKLLIIQTLGTGGIVYIRPVEHARLPDEGPLALGPADVGLEMQADERLVINRQDWGEATGWDWYAFDTGGGDVMFTLGVICD